MGHSGHTAAEWRKIQAAYQRGEGSCRILAERFGVKPQALRQRATREGWKKSKSQISEKVSQKVENELVDEATAWVKQMKLDCLRDRERIEASYEQMAPAADPLAIKHLTGSRHTVDATMRRSLGLPLGDSGRMKIEADGHGGVSVIYNPADSAI